MPYIDVETEVDLSVDEFLSECSSREIKEIIDALIEDGHLPKLPDKEELTFNHKLFKESMESLISKYLAIENEDLEILEKIFKKYL